MRPITLFVNSKVVLVRVSAQNDLKVRFHEHTLVSFCLDAFVNILMDGLQAL